MKRIWIGLALAFFTIWILVFVVLDLPAVYRRGTNEAAYTALFRIAEAEKIHKARYGKYAALEELVLQSLLENKYGDGRHLGYRLSIRLTETGYLAEAIPDRSLLFDMWISDEPVYVNETGVIRSGTEDNSTR